jgi:hypothetical protein
MSDNTLNDVLNVVKENPHSGQALLLFALMKTIDIPKGGHMYMLAKLKEMLPETRQLAFGLMQLMAENKTQDDRWKEKVLEIESLIRGNS